MMNYKNRKKQNISIQEYNECSNNILELNKYASFPEIEGSSDEQEKYFKYVLGMTHLLYRFILPTELNAYIAEIYGQLIEYFKIQGHELNSTYIALSKETLPFVKTISNLQKCLDYFSDDKFFGECFLQFFNFDKNISDYKKVKKIKLILTRNLKKLQYNIDRLYSLFITTEKAIIEDDKLYNSNLSERLTINSSLQHKQLLLEKQNYHTKFFK